MLLDAEFYIEILRTFNIDIKGNGTVLYAD